MKHGTSVDVYPLCPKCHSIHTGFIKPRTVWSGKKEAKDLYRSISRGQYVKYVNEKQYETYYKRYGINMYCEDCNYEFHGETKSVLMDLEDADDYLNNRGCENKLQIAKMNKASYISQLFLLVKKIIKKEN